ncbi:trypsin-like serine peptidase [Zafaria sp. Z1313]|uniref:trypsin-like serine peptidase n=1 Tax=Zafaria sp. Z1313 TaxID=3423202 RepID=UPI003D301A3A
MPQLEPEPLDAAWAAARPQSGDVPQELNDPANYLVFDRVADATGEGPAATSVDADGRLAITDPESVLGIVLGAAEPSTPEDVQAEVDALPRSADDADPADGGGAYVPDWIGVSPTPSIAPAADPQVLIRRSGAKVRPEWVIPPDNRTSYYPNTYPFSCVGRIFVWRNAATPNWTWWGTAGLLGTRTILTASHVVPWGSANWKALFVPAFYDGASIHGSWAASWVTNVRGYQRHAQGDDMAVLRLAVPLGNNLGWFGFQTYRPAWQDRNIWTLPGYPWDKDGGNRPWLHLNFPIIDDDNDGAGVELEYRADTEGGQSGAPVFAWFSGTPCVVGTHSGGEDNFGEPRQNVAAGGAALTNLLHWARSTWP